MASEAVLQLESTTSDRRQRDRRENHGSDDQSSQESLSFDPSQLKDHFVERDGLRYAGTHLLVDLWEAEHLDDLQRIEQMLRDAVSACGATLLDINLHRFSPTGGISGVAVLAESHISIHTWPERGYAAVDIFMCGHCKPHRAVPILRRALACQQLQLSEQKRGVLA